MPKIPPTDYYYNPETTGYSFEERTGDPDSFSAAIGRVVLNFSELESQVGRAISICLELDPTLGRIVTSEMSFRGRLHILSSLVRHLSPCRKFNVGDSDPIESWEKLYAQSSRAEELRNQVIHSEWSGPYLRDLKATRRKFTAKGSRGLREQVEIVSDAKLLDIADYIINVAILLEEFFFVFYKNT